MRGRRPAKRTSADEREHMKTLMNGSWWLQFIFKIFIVGLLMIVLVKYHYFKWYGLPKIDEEFDVPGLDDD